MLSKCPDENFLNKHTENCLSNRCKVEVENDVYFYSRKFIKYSFPEMRISVCIKMSKSIGLLTK